MKSSNHNGIQNSKVREKKIGNYLQGVEVVLIIKGINFKSGWIEGIRGEGEKNSRKKEKN